MSDEDNLDLPEKEESSEDKAEAFEPKKKVDKKPAPKKSGVTRLVAGPKLLHTMVDTDGNRYTRGAAPVTVEKVSPWLQRQIDAGILAIFE